MISSLLLLLLMVSVGLVAVVLMVLMDDCYRYSCYYYCYSPRYSQHSPLPSDSQATSSATAIDSIDLPHQPAETKTAGCSCSALSSPSLYYYHHHHHSYPCCCSPRQPAASTARPRSLPTGPRPLPLSRSGAALASVGPRSAAVPAGAPRATAILRWCWCWMMAGGRCRSWGSMLLLLLS